MTVSPQKWREAISMQIKNTYPQLEKIRHGKRKTLKILRWPFICMALASVIVNLCIGSPYWFVIVLISLYAIWRLIFSTDLVEYNRISQTTKIVVFCCILLTLIDILLAPVWAVFVVPIVCFSGLLFCAILFFTNFNAQKHNMFPMILLIFFSIIASGVSLIFWHDHDYWPLVVLGGISVILLISFIIILGTDFRLEMKRRFHIK